MAPDPQLDRVVRNTMHQREVFMRSTLDQLLLDHRRGDVNQFPPLAKNVLMASKEVAEGMFLVIFSVGVAIGSVAHQRRAQGHGLATRYARFRCRDGR